MRVVPSVETSHNEAEDGKALAFGAVEVQSTETACCALADAVEEGGEVCGFQGFAGRQTVHGEVVAAEEQRLADIVILALLLHLHNLRHRIVRELMQRLRAESSVFLLPAPDVIVLRRDLRIVQTNLLQILGGENQVLEQLRLRFVEGVVGAQAVDCGVTGAGQELVHGVADLAAEAVDVLVGEERGFGECGFGEVGAGDGGGEVAVAGGGGVALEVVSGT